MKTNIRFLLTASLVFALAFNLSCDEGGGGKLTDSRDGKKYKVVKINNQTWMAENLAREVGDSKCYDNEPENCKKYGRLYSFNEAKIACPEGWHLPSDEEWEALINYVGEKTAGTKLKATSGWNIGDGYIAGTDEYGFSALPGGDGASSGDFYNVGNGGLWWSASQYNSYDAYYRSMSSGGSNVFRDYARKSGLLSVRCLKNLGEARR